MEKVKFVTEVEAYDETRLDVDSNCNAILFSNTAAATVFVNGFPVASGGVLFVDGNLGELNTTKYKLSFGAGNIGQVFVMRKKYI